MRRNNRIPVTRPDAERLKAILGPHSASICNREHFPDAGDELAQARGVANDGTGAREFKVERRAKILCATDALLPSDAALWRAHAIARTLGAQLLLLHVIDSANPARAARQSERARVILDAYARELAQRDQEVQISIRAGRPYETIADVAIAWDADLIVLGPYRRRFRDSVRGTSAERVIRNAERPVLVVNRKSAGTYERVLLTSDLSHTSAGTARVAKQLGLLEASEASVVHALEHTRGAMLYLAGVRESEAGKYQRSLGQIVSSQIKMQLARAGLNSSLFSVFSSPAAPIRAIEQVAQRVRADLIVVGSSRFPALKRLFVSSVSNEVLRKSRHDVLLVSPAAARRARQRPLSRVMYRSPLDCNGTRRVH